MSITESDKRLEMANLWPRFRAVNTALWKLLLEEGVLVNRDMQVFEWSGVDAGVVDLMGDVLGVVGKIALSVQFKGAVVQNQQKRVEKDGKWVIELMRERSVTVSGRFFDSSRYPLPGMVEIGIRNDKVEYEAYWLRCRVGGEEYLRLEQVVAPSGDTFVANRLTTSFDGDVYIPGMNWQPRMNTELVYQQLDYSQLREMLNGQGF